MNSEKKNWEGLWKKEGKNYYSSKTYNLDELKRELGTSDIKIIVVKNDYYKEGSNQPQLKFVFSTNKEQPKPSVNESDLGWF